MDKKDTRPKPTIKHNFKVAVHFTDHERVKIQSDAKRAFRGLFWLVFSK